MRTMYFALLFSSLCCVVLSACEISSDRVGVPLAQTAGQLSSNPCTAVALTTPAQAWTAVVGQTIQLSASATCPDGVVPEFEFWRKDPTAANWTQLDGSCITASGCTTTVAEHFVSAGASFTPLASGSLCFSVVARGVGDGPGYEARSSGACGTVTVGSAPPSNIATIAIDASAFHPITSATSVDYTSGIFFEGGVGVEAPLWLPDGVEIVAARFFVADSPGTIVQGRVLHRASDGSLTGDITAGSNASGAVQVLPAVIHAPRVLGAAGHFLQITFFGAANVALASATYAEIDYVRS